MDCAINPPSCGKNFAHGINTTDKHYLKEQVKFFGKLTSKYTSKIGMLPSASKDGSINFS